LPASTRRGSLRSDLLRLELSLDSDDFDLDRIKPVLNAALADHLDDTLIWGRVYDAVTESTPPPRPIASLQQTPWLRHTSSFANSSEHHEYVDDVLNEELGPMYVGLQDFYKSYFGDNCLGGSNPLFCNGWRGWPKEAKQDDVLSWFADFTEKLAAFVESCNSAPVHKRRPLAKPDQPIAGSVGKRKMDIGFVDDPNAGKDSRCHWSQILVPGELKSNPSADRPSEARLDLGRYAREVLAAQDNHSWQYLEREEEGEFLSEATDKGVVHVARHYHHETFRVQGMDDDVRGNVRQGLDVTKATNYWQNRSRRSPSTNTEGPSRVGRSSSIASPKRSSHETGAFLPPSKRPYSTSPTKAGRDVLLNRVHWCVILSDWGIPIYKAGSRAALLAALADCIEGHESLRQKAGLLHRDISIGNLMVSKDNGGFFIDLDLAVKEQRCHGVLSRDICVDKIGAWPALVWVWPCVVCARAGFSHARAAHSSGSACNLSNTTKSPTCLSSP
ncbi:hypothetical protein N658DRAFT_500058, partial [Parathielavia hyrcaniae]